ncbi:MAG TPA: family 10 glycosylhydrolase [Bacillota bacterium]|nr:family 10 glycosylhydrolase [Bacillota bacterium]
MNNIKQIFLIFAAVFLVVISGGLPINAEETARPEVRALWVDAFRDGIKTPAQVDQLIQDSLKANINTLIVQVRRRGDSYYNNSIEPRTEDPVLQPGFDALQDLIEKAHAHHIEVHAWLNTLVAWNSSTPPQDPNHLWNLHGPQVTGRANWISYSRSYNKAKKEWSDTLTSSYFLDPGHPDVIDYTADVYLNVVKHYDVDGIHLDYSRYASQAWGYNPTSVARYNAEYGTTGLPDPDDPRWLDWRREQTENLIKKIYLKAIAIKPNLKVSSAVITWGDGPITDDDWYNSRAYRDVCQDWRRWLQEGIIDMAIPMNYFPEWSTKNQLWYNRWIEWEKDHQYGRQIIIGPGTLSQYIEDSLEQIRRAQSPSANGNYAAGVSLFAYGASHLYSCDDFKEPGAGKGFPRQPYTFMPETNGWLYPLLSSEGGYTDPLTKTYIPTKPVFPTPVPVPDMPWKSKPTKGYLMGTVTDPSGKIYDHYKITVVAIDPVTLKPNAANASYEVYTDGNGWFGSAELLPGKYRVSLAINNSSTPIFRDIAVEPGRVTETTIEAQ